MFLACCYCYKHKQGKQKLQGLTKGFRKSDADEKVGHINETEIDKN